VETLPWINIRRRRDVCWSWDDNPSLSLFVYNAVGSGHEDEVTDFIHAFKGSKDYECYKTAIVEVYEAAGKYIEEWKREYDCRYVVPVPSSRAREISGYSKDVCKFIASTFHLEYREALFRERTVPSSHMATYGHRLGGRDQFDSLACRETNLAGAGVILFDDVLNTGNTSHACRWRLKGDAKCGKVIRLFLARTHAACE
jgi:predicted amidophosphoribosyltransferase